MTARAARVVASRARPMRFTSSVSLLVAALAACDDAGTVLPADAGVDRRVVEPGVVGRGEYLVRSVAGCGECHTPRDAQGNLVMSRWLAGVDGRFDLDPEDDGVGAISTGNLTSDVDTGIGGWSDAAIVHAMRDGVAADGSPLFPLMPYASFHNMSDDDASAIVAYLRTVSAVRHPVQPRQPLPVPLDAPAPPVAESAIPHTTLPASDANFARAEHGRYLAGEVGFCLDCHTPWRYGAAQPLDTTRVFAGGRGFSAREWVVPPPAPPVVYSFDITPHADGIAGWKPQTVATALRAGLDDQGQPLLRPMPSGPLGAFGGLTEDDALDIGWYLTTLPPTPLGGP